MSQDQLQVLLDKQAICELIANYARALNRLDGALRRVWGPGTEQTGTLHPTPNRPL